MDRTGRLVNAARRRFTIAGIVESVGRWLAYGAAAGCLLAFAVKAVGWPSVAWTGWKEWGGAGVPAVWLMAGLLLATVVAGAVIGLLRRPSALATASAIDTRLHLKDRLSNGMALGSPGLPPSPFAEIARQAADSAADQVRLRTIAPIRFGRSWGTWPLLVVAALAIGAWAPNLNLLGAPDPAMLAQRDAERDEVAAAIAEATQAALVQPAGAAPDPVAARHLAELDAIRRELDQGVGAPDEGARRAAKALDQLAERADERARESVENAQAVRDALVEAGNQTTAPERPAEAALTEALRDADFARASEAARELLRGSQSTSEAERQNIAESLERLARDLEQVAERREHAETFAHPQTRAESEAKAVDDENKLPAEESRESDAQPATEQPSPTQGQPQRQPDRSEPTSQPTDAKSNAQPPPERRENPVESLRDAIRRAAEHVKQNSRPGDQPSESSESDPKPTPDRNPRPGESRQQQHPQSQHQSQSQQQEQQQRQESGEQKGTARETPQSGDPTRAGERRAEEGNPRERKPEGLQPQDQRPSGRPSQTGQQEKAERAKGAREPDERQFGAQQGNQESQPEPSDQETQASGDSSPRQKHEPQHENKPAAEMEAQGDRPQPSEQGLKDLERQLDRLAKAAKEAANDRRQADDLRRQAQEMLDKTSPEQREQIRKWAEKMAARNDPNGQRDQSRGEPDRPGATRDGGQREGLRPDDREPGESGATGQRAGERAGSNRRAAPSEAKSERTELVDARRPPDPDRPAPADERVAAEWLGAGERAQAPSAELSRRIEKATRSAERAIEDRAVPARFDRLLERYFRRLPERIAAPEATPAPPPALPAKDAP